MGLRNWMLSGLDVLSFGNLRMKSPAQLSRKLIELRSDVEMSEVEEVVVVVVSGLEAAEDVSMYGVCHVPKRWL